MNLLGAILYDPASAVNKVTTSAIAMTAIDTTNLRLAITVPAHGMVRFRLAGTLHGATTMPQIMLGVMNGSTVLGRMSPMHGATNIAATSLCKVEADFTVTGLTPGAMNCDAAYGVETVVASTGLKYGGPNNTSTNDAFGGFVFEAWNPQAQTANSTLAVDSNGRVDVIKIAGTTQTARDIGASVIAASVTGMTASDVGAIKAKTDNLPAAPASTTNITAGTITTVTNLTNAPTAGDFTATMKTSIGTAVAASAVASVTGNVGGNVTGSVGSVVGLTAANLDVAVSSRLASAGYTAPDNVTIAQIDAAILALNNFDPAVDVVLADVKKVNGVTVNGDGVGTPMGV